jgi:hypothetical protein
MAAQYRKFKEIYGCAMYLLSSCEEVPNKEFPIEEPVQIEPIIVQDETS